MNFTQGSMTIWPISRFDECYDILNKLGEGKFGSVFHVRLKNSKNFPNDFAAKFMKCEKASRKLKVRDEIEILQLFDHKNVLKLFAAHEDETTFIQVLEYLPGGPLFQRVMQYDADITEPHIAFIIRQICDALRYIGRFNVVHLDIKPENIVCSEMQGFQVKIVDFGFAKRLDPNVKLRVNEGTPEFVSPEVIKSEPISLKTDMWSVGVMTYVLLSGLSPFLGEEIEDTFDNILHANFTLEEPEFEIVSDKAKDFIECLLIVNQDVRMSSSSSLHHQWLISCKDFEARRPSCPYRKTSYDRRRLQNFSKAKYRWQKCANVIKACKTLKKSMQ